MDISYLTEEQIRERLRGLPKVIPKKTWRERIIELEEKVKKLEKRNEK